MPKIPRSKYPKTAENQLVNTLKRAIAELWERWEPRLQANIRRDDQIDIDLFDVLYRELEEAIIEWSGELRLAGREAMAFMRNQFIAQFRAAYGADPILQEFWAEIEFEQFVEETLRRVRGSVRDGVDRMRVTTSQGRSRVRPAEQIQQQVEAVWRVLEARVVFHAADEFTNLVADTNRQRLQGFDIDDYIWRDMRDKRVRGRPDGLYPRAKYSHWHRNGKTFKFSDPPPDGNPGEPDRCRCVAEPIFPSHGRKDPGLLAYLLAGAALGAATELNRERTP